MRDVARFLSLEKYAIAGVSRDPKKFGQVVFRDLRKKGMDVVPINPKADTIDGVKCYSSVSDLPADVRGLSEKRHLINRVYFTNLFWEMQ